MSSVLRLWGVRALGEERVVVVASRSSLAARQRVAERSSIPLAKLIAEAELEPFRRTHWRCGQVGVDVIWSHRERRWHSGVVVHGSSRYPVIDGGMPPSRKGADQDAAERAIQALRADDDLDDSLLLWMPGGERLHVVEAKGSPMATFSAASRMER
jgi:hypothetical protein